MHVFYSFKTAILSFHTMQTSAPLIQIENTLRYIYLKCTILINKFSLLYCSHFRTQRFI